MISPAEAALLPPGSDNVFATAALWVEGVLTGPVASSVAIIGVAWIGVLLLQGRLRARRGLTVAVGCFILFGSSAIAQGLLAASGRDKAAPLEPGHPPQALTYSLTSTPQNSDPYAGAALRR